MQESPAVLRDVLAPSLRPNHVEEACVAAQLLPEHQPEHGLGAQDLQPLNARVNAALLAALYEDLDDRPDRLRFSRRTTWLVEGITFTELSSVLREVVLSSPNTTTLAGM